MRTGGCARDISVRDWSLRAMLACSLALAATAALAQPTQEQVFALNASVVQVIVEHRDGSTGTGSGVVVNGDYVATNCHVLANTRGVNIVKLHQTYTPVALRADWAHDLCLLRFDGLPFQSVPMVDSSQLQYEQEVFSISYPYDNQVPQPSYGSIKALYPLDGARIIRTDAAFAMGSSGGALFDQQLRLIGITTFKSPGRSGYFYNLPVEWIRRLFDSPDVPSLSSQVAPFWSLPEQDRPYFMRVVIPYQRQQWTELLRVARAWSEHEADNGDAWLYRGLAEYGLQHPELASQYLHHAVEVNPRLLAAQIQLAHLSIAAGDKAAAQHLIAVVAALDADAASALQADMAGMP